MDSNLFKLLVGRLADRLSSSEGGLVLSQLQTLGLLHAGIASKKPQIVGQVEQAPAQDHIGVWKRTETADGAEYVRSKSMYAEWRFWADIERIPTKGSRKRIVLIGESVARAYFYDPGLTAGRLLERLFDDECSKIEVIDLARTDLRPQELTKLLAAIPALQPDALVVFAGNNWHYGETLSPGNILAFSNAITFGIDKVRDLFVQQHLKALAERIAGAVASTVKSLRIPAVFVIPGFNLEDWRDVVPLPMLEKNAIVQWERKKKSAEKALAKCNYIKLENTACEMIIIDHGLSPASYSLLGCAYAGQGKTDEARKSFSMARDALCGLPYPSSPRCPEAIRETLLSAAQRHGLPVIDVTAVLSANECIPGKRFFMDYCHHTIEGLSIVLYQVAQALSSLGPSRSVAIEELLTRRDRAMAHLLAAIHNAQFHQPREILDYHCMQALRLDSEIAVLMTAFMEFRTSAGPDWLHEAYKRFCSFSNGRRYLSKDAPNKPGKNVPQILLEIIEGAMEKVGATDYSTDNYNRNDLFSEKKSIDMTNPFFCAKNSWVEYDARAFYVAKERDSEFWFTCGKEDIALELCCRIRSCRTRKAIKIKANGRVVSTQLIGQKWSNTKTTIDKSFLNDGKNLITIQWPLPRYDLDALLEQAQNQFERGRMPDLFPSFGEVFVFRARKSVMHKIHSDETNCVELEN